LMFRYLALLWNPQSEAFSAAAEILQRRIQALSASWVTALRQPGVVVLVADRSHHLSARALFGGHGVILGQIFPSLKASDEGAVVEAAEFGATETRAVLESEGRILVSRYWGNYVALILDAERGARFLIKGPCGSLPCHFTQNGGLQLVFSCLGDCHELGLRFPVNWGFVRARIANGFREVREPSLLGMSTVYRGECVRFNREALAESRTQYWQADFTGSAHFVDPEVAQRTMRATVMSCVHSMATGHSSVLAQVSGGLDSSIVLGCLGAMPRQPAITCYTFYVPDSVCDERRWAHRAVQQFRLKHVEAPLDPRKLVYEELPALQASTEPASYFTHWQKSPVERDLATRYGASIVFTGEGGDAAFCSTSFVFAVDHCLRREGLSYRTLRTAAQVAVRRDRTVWRVLGKALDRWVFGDRGTDVERSLEPFHRLVSRDVRAAARLSLESLLRMGTLVFAPSFYDASTSHRDAAPYEVSPLCAQPVVELCACVPVDMHFHGGRTRGLARRAFANEVPEPILRRQWKDRPLLQLADVIARNLPFIREHLLEGALVKEGVLNRAAVEQALRCEPGSGSAIGSEILSHLDVELWIRDSA
jgi:asparagine synthase (glutamine-hydrolysing)